ncbi:MAG: hypothetical protein KA448_02450 [Leptotrichiaceae bacterium]|nr:hypothetical protein [Leptotrichiaceae bacterium]MBP6168246.1 hypothetical protein [Leptotrichiaceae bacterium]MBP7026355.1 hypothetical protein [Leptotrichiaceae bacterium]MBP8637017.1 hypothetical protein [Leptotrichiaceae bacterium]MBP9538879.1 hypothetical protein [Leptotrichiaceae bacterium]
MNKLIFIPILLIFINCTALNTLPNTDFESEKINIENITLEIKDAASLNKYNKLKEFFLPTFRNNIILNELEKNDISLLTLTFSKAIQISKNKAQSTMIINYDSTSEYFNIIWQKKNDQWKIANVEEKS